MPTATPDGSTPLVGAIIGDSPDHVIDLIESLLPAHSVVREGGAEG
jgi:hypothetical protein